MNPMIKKIKSKIKVEGVKTDVQLKEVDMEIIRYANCWEDADVLLSGLGEQGGNSILSIASGGDNSLSLLTLNPEKVVAVDLNQTQLFVLELKREAIRALSHVSFLRFIGFRGSENRFKTYVAIRPNLDLAAQRYWDDQIEVIEKGLVYEGKFERYLLHFCQRVLPYIHSEKMVEKLLAPKSGKAQKKFVEKHWNTLRWRLMFKVFFSKFCLGYFGRDPQFLKEVDVKVGSFLLDKANAYLSTTACQKNWMLQYILRGEFGDSLPHYAKAENFRIIKRNIDKLHLQKGLVEDAVKRYGKFDAFNLSNIFEYMDTTTFNAVGSKLIKGSNRGAKLVYWNLMVPCSLSQAFLSMRKLQNPIPLIDKGFFYRSFHVDECTLSVA